MGITVALETHKGPTQNADAMLALMDELDHPHVRLNFDTGNIAYYNRGVDPADELEKVKHLVRNVHLKDNRGRLRGLVLPGRRRRRERRLHAGPRDPRRRRLRRPLHDRDRGDRRRARAGPRRAAGPDRAERRPPPRLRLLRLMADESLARHIFWVVSQSYCYPLNLEVI